MIRKVEDYGPWIVTILGILSCIIFSDDIAEISCTVRNDLKQYIVIMSSIFLSFNGVVMGILYTLLENVKKKVISYNMYGNIVKYTKQSIVVNFVSVLIIMFDWNIYEYSNVLSTGVVIVALLMILAFNYRIMMILFSMVDINIVRSKYK